MEKRCPKCNQIFYCLENSSCWCFNLTNVERVEGCFTDCLCKECLLKKSKSKQSTSKNSE